MNRYLRVICVATAIILLLPRSIFASGPAVRLKSHKLFAPDKGKTLLMIGQDADTIDNYHKEIGMNPGGVMIYTNIHHLDGLEKPFNNGAGVHHGKYLLREYPDSVLQIGLYMVGALRDVNAGKYDSNIVRLGKWIKKARRPVFLRIGYEFDLGDNNYDPHEYIEAFQRIVERFRILNVKNVSYVWHSGAYDNTGDPFKWYPGDEYVDWFAASLFNPMQYGKIKLFAKKAEEKSKPFMLAETTPAGTYSERAKLDWFKKLFFIIDELKPQAVCYINSDWDSQPMWKGQGWGDSRVQKFPALKKFWLKEIRKKKYIHKVIF